MSHDADDAALMGIDWADLNLSLGRHPRQAHDADRREVEDTDLGYNV